MSLQQKNPVVFLPAWIDACALWRLYMPHRNLPGSSFFAFVAKPDWDAVAGNEVVVVQRCCTNAQMEFLKIARQLDMKIAYDLDDNMFDVPTYNPAYEMLTKARSGFIACMQMVDVITVSTRTLEREIRKHLKIPVNAQTRKEIPIMVCENRIDERLFAQPVIAEQRIVGWAGSSSHVGDLPLIAEAVQNCGAEFPEVVFEFRGHDPLDTLVVQPNFRWMPWLPVSEYPARMPTWGWSISLAPVTDHDLNSCKSAIKMVEAGYCGIPCLASWVRPYEEFCSHDPELKWLLCAGSKNFEKKLRELLNDPARAADLGRRCQQVVQQHYSWNRPHEGWQQVWQWLGVQ